jgi:hypothetical protein
MNDHMLVAPGSARPPPDPLLTKRWVIVCVIAALFAADYVNRRNHRPLCVDACAHAGEALLEISLGSAGRASLFDNSIHCLCSEEKRVRLYMAWSEYFKGFEVLIWIAALLTALTAMARWLWRKRAGG